MNTHKYKIPIKQKHTKEQNEKQNTKQFQRNTKTINKPKQNTKYTQNKAQNKNQISKTKQYKTQIYKNAQCKNINTVKSTINQYKNTNNHQKPQIRRCLTHNNKSTKQQYEKHKNKKSPN